jgi:hypothetical protein
VPVPKSGADDALHFKLGDKLDISAPKSVVETGVRCWEYTLYWYGSHPIQGTTILGFLLILALIKARSKRDTTRMNQEYRDKIEASKQPQLPLPPPSRK